jgi:hypothetical protein
MSNKVCLRSDNENDDSVGTSSVGKDEPSQEPGSVSNCDGTTTDVGRSP